MPASSKNSGKTNRLPSTNASSKLGKGRRKDKDPGSQRSAETIQRLNMYKDSGPIRNKSGKVVGGSFLMKDRSGDAEITGQTGRIQPDRRWFGNTRVVGATDLDRFRAEMTEKVSDPYSVVLKRKKLPMGLLRDAAEYSSKESAMKRSALLAQEPFEHAFGKASRRKRVKLDQLLVDRGTQQEADRIHRRQRRGGEEGRAEVVAGTTATSSRFTASKDGRFATRSLGDTGGGDVDDASHVANATVSVESKGNNNSSSPTSSVNHNQDEEENSSNDNNGDTGSYGMLLRAAQRSRETYDEANSREGIVPWGRDSNLPPTEGEGVDWRREKKDDLFLKGQSKRIWGEFFKVIDCSDVVLHVIDARNVPGTRCTVIERHIANNVKHKHLVFVLNKIDLVPNWVAKRWMGELAKDRPTIAFHASMTNPFGKGALISLLRQFGKLHDDKKQISVGVVGYPNCGKSSIINCLISKKSCKVAPIPGETKIWQYVTLFKRISLIDCPGVVVDAAGDTETDSVLKGVVRAERLENPEDFVDAILNRVKREHVAAQYKLPKDGDETWNGSTELLEMISRRSGRLLKGGDPCIRTAAITIINDFQRGRLPHYVAPPELKEEEADSGGGVGDDNGVAKPALAAPARRGLRDAVADVSAPAQNLDAVGEEFMKPDENLDASGESFTGGRGGAAADPKRSDQIIGPGEWDD
jgi:ribosome biogenesis GTPase A